MSAPITGSDRSSELKLWSGYFKKTLRERQDQLSLVFPHLNEAPSGLENNVADVMVENCIGSVGLPLGVAPTFFINGNHYVVPMAVEEPSVIAAASGAAKLVAKSGGFHASSTGNIMIGKWSLICCIFALAVLMEFVALGQVQVLDIPFHELQNTANKLREAREDLISEANRFCASMVKRGGGVIDVNVRVVEPRSKCSIFQGCLVVHVHVNVCEAMGANVVNTIVEGMAPLVQHISGGRVGLKILSNLCLERRSKAAFRIPVQLLAWKGVSGMYESVC